MEECPQVLAVAWILSQFGRDESRARARYRCFVADGLRRELDPMTKVEGQIMLGTPGFVESRRDLIEAKRGAKENPRVQRQLARPSISELFDGCSRRERKDLMAKAREAHVVHGYTLKAIAEHLGIHYATAGRFVRASLSALTE